MASKELALTQTDIVPQVPEIPFAQCDGIIRVGDTEITCAVLNDGRRVLSQEGFLHALGRARKAKGGHGGSSDNPLPPFLAAKNLRPFISAALEAAISPIVYRPLSGGYRGVAYGYAPDLLKLTCQVYVDALNMGSLVGSQIEIAEKCQALLSALESLALVALIDEATGYQTIRPRNALQELLDLYVAEEFRPWTKQFPDEYYRQLFRLEGWDYDTSSVKRPKRIGKLTDIIIYQRLPVGVREDLRNKNPVIDGSRRHKHHQLLTKPIGIPHLEKQLAVATTIMRGFKDTRSFLAFYGQVAPATPDPNQSGLFDAIEDDDDDQN